MLYKCHCNILRNSVTILSFFSPVEFNIDPIPNECYDYGSFLYPWVDDDGFSYYYAFGITRCLSVPLPSGSLPGPIPTCLKNLQDCCWKENENSEDVELTCSSGFHRTCNMLCCENNSRICVNAGLTDCTCNYIDGDDYKSRDITSKPPEEPSTDRQKSTIGDEGSSAAQIRYVCRSKYTSFDLSKS